MASKGQRFNPAYLHQTNHKALALWFELFRGKLRIWIPKQKTTEVFYRMFYRSTSVVFCAHFILLIFTYLRNRHFYAILEFA